MAPGGASEEPRSDLIYKKRRARNRSPGLLLTLSKLAGGRNHPQVGVLDRWVARSGARAWVLRTDHDGLVRVETAHAGRVHRHGVVLDRVGARRVGVGQQ